MFALPFEQAVAANATAINACVILLCMQGLQVLGHISATQLQESTMYAEPGICDRLRVELVSRAP